MASTLAGSGRVCFDAGRPPKTVPNRRPPDTRSWIKSIRPVPKGRATELLLGILAGMIAGGALYALSIAEGPAWVLGLAGFFFVAMPALLYALLWRRALQVPSYSSGSSGRTELDLMRKTVDRVGAPWALRCVFHISVVFDASIARRASRPILRPIRRAKIEQPSRAS